MRAADTVFDTFPWPQAPTPRAVADAAVALRTLRHALMTRHGSSLRTLETPGAFLLTLNLTLAAKEKAGEKIAPPGLPLPEAERPNFITDDCVRVADQALSSPPVSGG